MKSTTSGGGGVRNQWSTQKRGSESLFGVTKQRHSHKSAICILAGLPGASTLLRTSVPSTACPSVAARLPPNMASRGRSFHRRASSTWGQPWNISTHGVKSHWQTQPIGRANSAYQEQPYINCQTLCADPQSISPMRPPGRGSLMRLKNRFPNFPTFASCPNPQGLEHDPLQHTRTHTQLVRASLSMFVCGVVVSFPDGRGLTVWGNPDEWGNSAVAIRFKCMQLWRLPNHFLKEL